MLWLIIGVIIILIGFEAGIAGAWPAMLLGVILCIVGWKKLNPPPPPSPEEQKKIKEEKELSERRATANRAYQRFNSDPYLNSIYRELVTEGFPSSREVVEKDIRQTRFAELRIYKNKIVRKTHENEKEWLFSDGRINNLDSDSCNELAHWFGSMLLGDSSQWYTYPIEGTVGISAQSIILSMSSDSYDLPDPPIIGYRLVKKPINRPDGEPFRNI